MKNISSTGSLLPSEGFERCYENVKKDLWIDAGTNVCTAFILGVPILSVYSGKLQCRGLGAKTKKLTDEGNPIIGGVGELVLTKPLPSMPIFWNDADGSQLHGSYFDIFPEIWHHGDYLKITDRGTCVIYGRSDATINRGGVRIGTSEIYRAVDRVKEVADSLIVEITDKDGNSIVPLFVVMQAGFKLTEDIKQVIKGEIRRQCSPRHVPTAIYEVTDLPQTLNGKKLEIPIKKILMGASAHEVVNIDSLANPEALEYFVHFAQGQIR